MDDIDRRHLTAKIISGIVFVDYKNQSFIINEAEPTEKYIAETIYSKHFFKALEQGIMTEDDLVLEMIKAGLWNAENENRLDELPKQIEDIKVDLYNAYANFSATERIRKALDKTKSEFSELMSKKGIYRKESAEGSAESMKTRYLITANVTDENGERTWAASEALSQDAGLSDVIMMSYLSTRVSEEKIRELSRNEPWRSVWNTGKAEHSLFGKPATNVTGEQQKIIAWSRVYDNIYESPECPPDDVLEDDDMLDGWLILQSRKRKQNKNRNTSEKSTNVKGNEVFFVADNKKDAQRIYDLNDSQSRKTIQQRDKQIGGAGKSGLDASKTFDAQLELTSMATQQFKNTARKK